MTSYIASVNAAITAEVVQIPNVVVYGENIDNGSHMSGLTRNLEVQNGGRVINIGNCEATHCGVGFGLMLNGVTGVLIAKQIDFLLLGIEQLVSTYGNIRSHRDLSSLGSFTIISVVCDQGYQGPQSSFNALGDICSMARIPGYTITNLQDASRVLGTQLTAPGFRFVCLSQRLFGSEIMDPGLVYSADDCSVFQYAEGDDVTVVCFNFSLPQGRALQQKLLSRGAATSLFSVNYVFPQDWRRIGESVSRTKKLVVIDDSKSVSPLGHRMINSLHERLAPFQSIVVDRETDIDFGVCPDNLQIDYDDLIQGLGL